MADALPVGRRAAGSAGDLLAAIARQREVSLLVVMGLLGAFVAVQAPQFLSPSNLTQVTVLASIIVIAAVGEALVILTRNVDLSVEAMMGLVAFAVADILRQHALGTNEAMAFGVVIGLVLGMINGVLVTFLRVPAIVATLGTLSMFRGFTYLVAGSKQVALMDLPEGYTDPAIATVYGIPLFVVIATGVVAVVSLFLRQYRSGRQVYAVGSNPDAAAILGIRKGIVIFGVFAVCGALSGVAGVMWGIEFGTVSGGAASGVTLQVIAAVVVGGVAIFGGSGTVVGRSARCRLPGLRRQRAHPAEGLPVPAASAVRRGDPPGDRPGRIRPAADAAAGRRTSSMTRLRGLARWEVLLAVAILLLIPVGMSVSRFFLTFGNVSNLTVALMEVGTMAIPMALLIIAGEIDLSVEAMVGLSCAILGFLWAERVPLWVGIPTVLLVGAIGGALNGFLVTRVQLPSLVVTIGTLALFRGLALVVLGPRGISKFPDEFTEFGFGTIPGTPIPWPFLVFAAVSLVLGVILHRTWLGRDMFAIGKNGEAARYSGVRLARLRMSLFILSGTIAALAGVILTARFASARADAGEGLTLTVVTVVLLGGVNIFGGRGTIPGVVLAVFVLAILGNVMRLAKISAEIQSIATGLLLIISVLVPTAAGQARQAIDRVKKGKDATRRDCNGGWRTARDR